MGRVPRPDSRDAQTSRPRPTSAKPPGLADLAGVVVRLGPAGPVLARVRPARLAGARVAAPVRTPLAGPTRLDGARVAASGPARLVAARVAALVRAPLAGPAGPAPGRPTRLIGARVATPVRTPLAGP